MNAIVLALMAATMLAGYAAHVGYLPRLVVLAPEALTALLCLFVVAYGARTRFENVRAAYWALFAGMGATLAAGAIANHVDPGPMVTGIRNYLRTFPVFLLPAVYAFSERQLSLQLKVLAGLCVLQAPLAIAQRNRELWWGNESGDRVFGTLMLSGSMSVFMVCAACVLTGFYLRRRLGLLPYLLLLAVFVTPTMVNETKATVVLLPIGLLVTFLVASDPRVRLKNLVVATGLVALFFAVFVPVYDYYIEKREYGVPLAEFFGDDGQLRRYMGDNEGLGSDEVGRWDAHRVPVVVAASDPVRLTLGLGMGNASASPLGAAFSGHYAQVMEPFMHTTASMLIVEAGLLGLFFALLAVGLIYRDARRVLAVDDGVVGALAVGWCGVAAVIALSTLYVNTITHEALAFLFWFYSGVVAAARMRIAR